MKKVVLFSFLAFVLAACSKKTSSSSSSASVIYPAQADIDRVAAKYPGFTMAEFNTGKSLFEGKCNMCHSLKNPASFSEKKLNEVVPPMVDKVNRKSGSKVLDDAAKNAILRYMVTMASK